jgi:hypothetical protein
MYGNTGLPRNRAWQARALLRTLFSSPYSMDTLHSILHYDLCRLAGRECLTGNASTLLGAGLILYIGYKFVRLWLRLHWSLRFVLLIGCCAVLWNFLL